MSMETNLCPRRRAADRHLTVLLRQLADAQAARVDDIDHAALDARIIAAIRAAPAPGREARRGS